MSTATPIRDAWNQLSRTPAHTVWLAGAWLILDAGAVALVWRLWRQRVPSTDALPRLLTGVLVLFVVRTALAAVIRTRLLRIVPAHHDAPLSPSTSVLHMFWVGMLEAIYITLGATVCAGIPALWAAWAWQRGTPAIAWLAGQIAVAGAGVAWFWVRSRLAWAGPLVARHGFTATSAIAASRRVTGQDRAAARRIVCLSDAMWLFGGLCCVVGAAPGTALLPVALSCALPLNTTREPAGGLAGLRR